MESHFPTTPNEVEELCRALENGKVVKEVANELAWSLSRLFNKGMRDVHYPACFKVARIVPIFKGKGEDPTDYAGYCLVSVLLVLSQLFERVLHARLVRFMDRRGVLSPKQYGFRSGHPTAMAVL